MKTLSRSLQTTKNDVAGQIRLLRSFLSNRQLEFVDDAHRFKVLVAGRRGGKSYADGVYMLMECLQKPGTTVIYLSLTRESSKRIIWPILTDFLSRARIEHTIDLGALTFKLANGSSLVVMGADMTNMKNRIRGQKFSLAIIDECGYFSGLRGLMDALIPALADYKGTLCMTSSPGEELTGPFYEAYEGKDKAHWHQFHWDMRSNPFFMVPPIEPGYATRADEEMATICRLQYGNDPNNPAFRREYLGTYVKDDKYMVYPVTADNLIPVPMVAPRVSLGVTLGPDGQFGAVTMEHSEYSRHVTILNSMTGSFSKTEDVELLRTFHSFSDLALIDPLDFGDNAVKELTKRIDLSFAISTIEDRPFMQYLMRKDLVDKYVRVKEDLPILTEWSTIVRDSAGVEKPDQERKPRLQANSALILYTRIYNTYLKHWTPPPTAEDKMIQSLIDQAEAEKEESDNDIY